MARRSKLISNVEERVKKNFKGKSWVALLKFRFPAAAILFIQQPISLVLINTFSEYL